MEEQIIQRYRREVYRIGWRLQYWSKKTYRHQCTFFDVNPVQGDESEDLINRLSVEHLLSTLPTRGREILQMLYLQKMTEDEVAAQLQMSQQGVNKWKRKMLQQLSQTVNL